MAAAMLLGIRAASLLSVRLWAFAVVLGCLPLLPGILNKAVRKQTWILTLSFLMACCLYWNYDSHVVQRQLSLAGKETVFSGVITGKQTYTGGWTRYQLKGTSQDGIPAGMLYFCNDPFYDFGDAVTLTGIPEKTQDSRVFLEMESAAVQYTPVQYPSFPYPLYRFREKLRDKLCRNMTAEGGTMLAGMLFGENGDMEKQSKITLYRAGIGHLLAVSGLHLDFLAMLLVGLLRRCKTGRYCRFFAVSTVCIGFAVCTGGSVSVRRACIMAVLSQAAGLFFRKSDALNSLALAVIVLCVKEPLVIFQGAFWLSVSGAFGIAVLAPWAVSTMQETTILHTIYKRFLQMLCVFLAVFPASSVCFGTVSLLSPLTNLLLVPLCMAALLSGVISLPFGDSVARYLLVPADVLCQLVQSISQRLSALPISEVRSFGGLWLPLFCVGMTALCCYLYRSRRLFAVCCAISLTANFGLAALCDTLAAQRLTVTLLGNDAQCVMILSCQGEAVAADLTGDSENAASAAAYLEKRGIGNLEQLLLCRPTAAVIRKYEKYCGGMEPAACVMLRENPKLVQPQLLGEPLVLAEEKIISFHGAEIRADSGSVTVTYGGVCLVCCADAERLPQQCDILAVSGNCTGVLPDCGMLIAPEEASAFQNAEPKTDMELLFAKDGSFRIRRLYGDS